MIKHIVMFKLKEEAAGKTAYENAIEAKNRLANFTDQIPSLKNLEVGINLTGAAESNCDVVLVCHFEDMDGLNAYQVHPAHVEFGKFIKEVRESRACIDYYF